MSHFPVSPRHARMLLEALSIQESGLGAVAAAASASSQMMSTAVQGSRSRSGGGGGSGARSGLLPYALALAAAMSVESPFMHIDNIKVCRPAGRPWGPPVVLLWMWL